MDPIRPSTGTDEAVGPATVLERPQKRSPSDRITDSKVFDRPVELHGGWAARWGRPYLLASGAYLILSLIIWSHVWTGHPTSVTTCGCGDTAPTIWYMAWPAYAMTHGLNPLYSTAIGYPNGVNLIFAAFGIVMAPFTWLFGPVAALNVVLTASPVLSALAMFALVRRWVSWMPAAFVAGLFYGFSPFVLINLGVAHVDFVMIAIPPLVVICLDELLIRQHRRPSMVGIALGLLIGMQFFVGAEILVLTIIEAVIGICMVVVYTAAQDPATLREHAGHAVPGFCAAALTALVLLAFPSWFALAGPAHFSEAVHPGLQLTNFSASIGNLVLPPPAPRNMQWQHIVGGYQGPMLSSQYFGLGVVLVCLGGLVVWRRDRLLWLFASLSVVTLFLATLSGPWLAALPLLKDVYLLHFVLFAYLTVAVMLGVIVDRSRSTVRQALERDTQRTSNVSALNSRKPQYRWTGALVALMVAVLAIAPPSVYLAKTIPITVEPIVLPTWFRTVAPSLPGHPVVLALPAPFTATKPGATWQAKAGPHYHYPLASGWKQAALTWHALSGQRYSMVGTGGLSVGVSHNPGEDQGQNVITQVTFAYASSPNVTASDIASVRRALSEWGVTMIVLPDQPELPAYDQVASVTGMAALIAAATGARPAYIADAWVWLQVDHDVPTAFPDAAQYARCTAGHAKRGIVAVNRAIACVLAHQ